MFHGKNFFDRETFFIFVAFSKCLRCMRKCYFLPKFPTYFANKMTLDANKMRSLGAKQNVHFGCKIGF